MLAVFNGTSAISLPRLASERDTLAHLEAEEFRRGVREMKIITCLIVLVFNGTLLLAQPSQTNLPDVIDGIRPSIARIEVTYSFTTQENSKEIRKITVTGSGLLWMHKGILLRQATS
jgi:hypothetical protein